MNIVKSNSEVNLKRDEAIRRALEMPHRPLKKKDDAANSVAKKIKASGRKPVPQVPEKA